VVALVGSGTQTATVGTTHDLVSSTQFGIFQCYWNLTNLAKGDVVRVFVTMKVLGSDTEETVFEGIYANDLRDSCIICSPPFVSQHICTMRLRQTAGTGRSFPWAMYRLDS
jgi:hypothetical protein